MAQIIKPVFPWKGLARDSEPTVEPRSEKGEFRSCAFGVLESMLVLYNSRNYRDDRTELLGVIDGNIRIAAGSQARFLLGHVYDCPGGLAKWQGCYFTS